MPIGAISVFDVQEWVCDLDADGCAERGGSATAP
jgi:hypothetical protein